MTKAKLNSLIALQEEWIKEAQKRGLDTQAMDRAVQRTKFTMNEMLDTGFGPNIDKIRT